MNKVSTLAGILAIKRDLSPKKKTIFTDIDRKNMTASDYNKSQVETIVKMAKEGASNPQIQEKTGVSKAFISTTKKQFGLLKPKLCDYVPIIKELIRLAPDFTYQMKTLHEATGINRISLRQIINRIPQIERGTEDGNKFFYRYNHDIKVIEVNGSRGAVR